MADEALAPERSIMVSEEQEVSEQWKMKGGRPLGEAGTKTRRRRAKWEDDKGDAIPTPDVRMQLATYLPDVVVSDEVVSMLEGFHVNDTAERGVEDELHVIAANQGSALAHWYLDEILIPRSDNFSIILRANETDRPTDDTFELLVTNPWFRAHFAENPSRLGLVKAELLREWDSLVADGYVRIESTRLLDGVAAFDEEKGCIVVTSSAEGEAGSTSPIQRTARLNKMLFLRNEDMLESMNPVTPTTTGLRNAYLKSGLDGSGEIVVMPVTAFTRFNEDWNKKHNIKKR